MSTEQVVKKQRIRGKNFTQRETDVLIEKMKEYMGIINKKFMTGDGKRQQYEAWEAIQAAVNAVGVCNRSVADLKEKWRNMVKKGKREYTEDKISTMKTGGGPPRPLDNATSEIINIMHGAPSFSGIPDAGDSETVIISDLDKMLDESLKNHFQAEFLGSPLSDTDQVTVTEETDYSNEQITSASTNNVCDTGKRASPKSTDRKKPEEKGKKCGNKTRTLKELQIDYYTRAMEVQEVQIQCLKNVTKLADVLIKKFSDV